MSLFDFDQQFNKIEHTPLAWQLKPSSFDDYIGQDHLLGKNMPFRKLLDGNFVPSMILWGPPGSGKTALAKCIANHCKATFISLNAVLAKLSDLRSAINEPKTHLKKIVFIDEIHRFSKTQQDALLPSVENGQITLIGATTENPFFHVISGLTSRCEIFELYAHNQDSLSKILNQAILHLSNTNKEIKKEYSSCAKKALVIKAAGDARKLINFLSICHYLDDLHITKEHINKLGDSQGININTGDAYDLCSALIKSMRGSDVNAALYYLARLLKGGQDPRYIARRLLIFASEDIGLADNHALNLASAAYLASETIGMPEIRINLSHVVCYLAKAKKCIRAYRAINLAMDYVSKHTLYPIPKHLRDAHYKNASYLGFGTNYVYPPDNPEHLVKQSYLPIEATDCDFFF